MPHKLPVGKLPTELLNALLAQTRQEDVRVLVGPGIGLDCAIIDMGDQLMALKSDPITFASNEIGWYAVQINANDIVTTGSQPRWMLVTLLLPEKQSTFETAQNIMAQLQAACQEIGVTIVGGHTEITYDLNRPIILGTMVGEVKRDGLITPRGINPGDRLLLTKGIPIEATAILAREFPERLSKGSIKKDEAKTQTIPGLSQEELEQAQNFLYQPGISIVADAQIALQTGGVSAMHDPTEGGLYAALWELAQASGCSLWVNPETVPIAALSKRICKILDIDPLGAIASGALLIAAPIGSALEICSALEANDITCKEIGAAIGKSEHPIVQQGKQPGAPLLPRPARDEIARIFES